MSEDDGFINIWKSRTAYQAGGVTKIPRPSSLASTSATESSDSSASELAPSAPEPAVPTQRLPAWKLREAAKNAGAPKRSISNSSTGRPPKMTMAVGTPSAHRRSQSTATRSAPIVPNPQSEEEDRADETVSTARSGRAARRAAREAARDSNTKRASSRDPTSRASRASSRDPSYRPRTSSSREPYRNRSEPSKRESSREPTRTRASSRDTHRVRSSSRDSRRPAVSAADETPATPSTVRTAPDRGYRRGMKKTDLGQNDENLPSLFRSYVPSTPSASSRSYLKPTKKEEEEVVEVPLADEPTSRKPDPQREVSNQSFEAKPFPSTFSFDTDDPFETSCQLVKIDPKILAPEAAPEPTPAPGKAEAASVPVPLKRKNSKTPKRSPPKEKDDDLSSVPSMFRASMELDKKAKKKSNKKSSSKSKKESKEESKKKKKSKTVDPESQKKTKKTKKSTKTSKKSSKEKDDETMAKLPDGFDWEVPVTPVFETPVSKAPKEKLRSKEDILANSKDNTEAFHNSLDNLFELPADLLSPTTGKIKMDEDTMPIIAFSDDASHASDMSSIHSISEYSEMDGPMEEESSTPMSRAKQRVAGFSGDRSVRSQRSGGSRITQNTRGTRTSLNSCGTTATAWQLREQQKHARRPGGRRGHGLQAPQTAPCRPRRAMTTQLKHQQIPMPPAFAALSAPSTPKTPAMNRRLMSSKERQSHDIDSSHRRGNIADSLLYFAGDDEEMSIEPDLLSQCSRSVYSTRSQNLKRFSSNPSDKRMAIPKNAKLETNPKTGRQQLVVDLGDVPAAFKASLHKK